MATQSKSTKKYYGEIGQSGVQIFNGIITGEEYNFNLIGRRALQTWDEMRKSDAQVKMSLKVVKEPVKALSYHVQPASDDPLDLEAAEFVDAQIFDILRWKTSLVEILTHLEFGFAVFEKVYDFGEVKGKDRVYIDKLAFRKQTSIAKWEADKGEPGISQFTTKGKTVSIPLDKLVVFTNEQEGDNFEGVSILRAAYKHWYYKDKLYQIDAIGHERQALGVIKVKHPKNAPQAQLDIAHAAARNLRANEEAYIDEPEGWTIEFMDMKAGSLKDTEPSINHHNRQIPVNVLAGFMDLGASSGSGSRAVGDVQLKVFEYAVKFVADYIADTVNRYLVKDIVDLNFNVTEYPKLTAGEVDGQSLTELATALKNLIDAGVIIPTDEDEAYLRGILRLPEKPEGEATDPEARKPRATKETPAKNLDEEDEDTKKASARNVAAAISSRDIPDLYDGTGVDPDALGCIMIDTDPLSVLEHVEDAAGDLYESKGAHGAGVPGETEAHVTLLYGLLENGNVWKKKVDAVLDGWVLPSVKIDHVDYFELGEKFAVVAHIEATPELIDGHERLTLLPHIQTFSEYKPHLTLAYIKPDKDVASKWVKALDKVYAGQELKTTGINYGDQPEGDVKASLVARARSVLASLREKLYGNSSRTS